MKLMNDPIEIITNVINENYPDLEVDIYFGEEYTDGENTWGVTIYPEDDSKPLIEVNPYLPLAHVAEIIAHEVAHVIAGHDAGHGEEWERKFQELSDKFFEKSRFK